MLEFVDSGLDFVHDEKKNYNSVVTGRIRIRIHEKGPDPADQKSTDPDPHPWKTIDLF